MAGIQNITGSGYTQSQINQAQQEQKFVQLKTGEVGFLRPSQGPLPSDRVMFYDFEKGYDYDVPQSQILLISQTRPEAFSTQQQEQPQPQQMQAAPAEQSIKPGTIEYARQEYQKQAEQKKQQIDISAASREYSGGTMVTSPPLAVETSTYQPLQKLNPIEQLSADIYNEELAYQATQGREGSPLSSLKGTAAGIGVAAITIAPTLYETGKTIYETPIMKLPETLIIEPGRQFTSGIQTSPGYTIGSTATQVYLTSRLGEIATDVARTPNITRTVASKPASAVEKFSSIGDTRIGVDTGLNKYDVGSYNIVYGKELPADTTKIINRQQAFRTRSYNTEQPFTQRVPDEPFMSTQEFNAKLDSRPLNRFTVLEDMKVQRIARQAEEMQVFLESTFPSRDELNVLKLPAELPPTQKSLQRRAEIAGQEADAEIAGRSRIKQRRSDLKGSEQPFTQRVPDELFSSYLKEVKPSYDFAIDRRKAIEKFPKDKSIFELNKEYQQPRIEAEIESTRYFPQGKEVPKGTEIELSMSMKKMQKENRLKLADAIAKKELETYIEKTSPVTSPRFAVLEEIKKKNLGTNPELWIKARTIDKGNIPLRLADRTTELKDLPKKELPKGTQITSQGQILILEKPKVKPPETGIIKITKEREKQIGRTETKAISRTSSRIEPVESQPARTILLRQSEGSSQRLLLLSRQSQKQQPIELEKVTPRSITTIATDIIPRQRLAQATTPAESQAQSPRLAEYISPKLKKKTELIQEKKQQQFPNSREFKASGTIKTPKIKFKLSRSKKQTIADPLARGITSFEGKKPTEPIITKELIEKSYVGVPTRELQKRRRLL